MATDVLANKPRLFLLGNNAIVRGALEAGLEYASAYPGTPSSEIGNTLAKVAKAAGIYFEWATNEKVAVESAAGAAWTGLRTLSCMKHFGLNVASDTLQPIVYIELPEGAAFVVVVADDPNCWSSAQTEQDTRHFSRMGHIPTFEPADPQEAHDFTKAAFKLSSKYRLPVLVRETTRVAHVSAPVKVAKIPKARKIKPRFKKDLMRFDNLPPHILELKRKLFGKIARIEKNEAEKFTKIIPGKGKIGLITCGVGHNYALEALSQLKLNWPVLKLGMSYPLPEKKIAQFIKNLKTVLVVEELDPVIQKEITRIAKEVNPKLKIHGKDLLPEIGEYRVVHLLTAIGKLANKQIRLPKVSPPKLPPRKPTFCPGCPHRATFWAARKAAPNAIYGGDIGCYILGFFPPYQMQDFIICMGAVQGLSHGISKATDQDILAFIGDSTFFHAGMPGLVNQVWNGSHPVIIALDNRITAMTGHQACPTSERTAMGERTKEIKIEELAKASGVEFVAVTDPYNLKHTEKIVSDALQFARQEKKPALVVSKRTCALLDFKRKLYAGERIRKAEVDQEKCRACGLCYKQFGCPAIEFDPKTKKARINKAFCVGCGVCAQICPFGAIKVLK